MYMTVNGKVINVKGKAFILFLTNKYFIQFVLCYCVNSKYKLLIRLLYGQTEILMKEIGGIMPEKEKAYYYYFIVFH